MMKSIEQKKKAKTKSQTASQIQEALSRMQLRRTEDRSTKIQTTLGDTVATVAVSDDESLFAAGGTRAEWPWSSRRNRESAWPPSSARLE